MRRNIWKLALPIMQHALPLLLMAWAAPAVSAHTTKGDALGKVIELMDTLAAKITQDSVEEGKAFHAYFEWCDETSKNKQFEIKTSTLKKEKLESLISKSNSDAEASAGKISDLAVKIKQDTADLAAATDIRKKEAEDFAASEAELMDADDALTRAIGVIEKEMAKNPAAFAQVDTSSLDGLLGGLGAVLDAASFTNNDKQKLVALLQSEQGAEDEDVGAPDPKAYKSHSGGIVDVLENMKEKARTQLTELRQAETSSRHNYDLLKQGLEDTIAVDEKSLTDEKAFVADSEETKSVSGKDLVLNVQALKASEEALAGVQKDCMQTAADHEASTAACAEELKVIAKAKQILMDSSSFVQAPPSLLQVASASNARASFRTKSDLKAAEVAHMIKTLAKAQHSQALSQLASRIAAIGKFGASNGDDPFTKIKGLISDMIAKLEKEAKETADEKAYCDEQMSKTEEKKGELEDDKAKLTAKIDTKAAQSADLKKQVTELQAELAKLAKEQMELNEIREEQNAAYKHNKADLEKGLMGVRKALQVLREYYGRNEEVLLQSDSDQPARPVYHSKSSGAGGSIMDILEVVESDQAKALAAVEEEESDSLSNYEERTQEVKMSTALKQKDVKYKVQEFKGLDQAIDELEETRSSTGEELGAVLEYYEKVKQRCGAKPLTYEERKARREAEIKGLEEAMQTLSEEGALVQEGVDQKRVRLHLGDV